MPAPLKISFLLLSYLMAASLASAQQTKDARSPRYLELPVEQLSISKGLSQGMINGIAEDRDGFLWIATKDGLNRYDGTEFKVYRHDEEDTNSIAESFVTAVFVDSRNLLWIGTNSKGVDLFDRETGRFIHFGNKKNSPGSELIGVRNFYEDPSGNILTRNFLSSDLHVFVPNKSNAGKNKFSFTLKKAGNVYPLFNNVKTLDWEFSHGFTSDGTFWNSDKGRIYAFSPAMLAGKEKPRPIENVLVKFYWNNVSNALVLDKSKRNVYVLNDSNYIFKFDFVTRTFKPILKIPRGYVSANRGTFLDNSNRIWIVNENGDFVRVNLEDNSITLIHGNWDDVEKAAGKFYAITLQDKSNNLWLGSSGYGLLKLNSGKENFVRIPVNDLHSVGKSSVTTAETNAMFDTSIINRWHACRKKIKSEQKYFDVPGHDRTIAVDKNGNFWNAPIFPGIREIYLLKINSSDYTLERKAHFFGEGTAYIGQPIFPDRNDKIWFGYEHRIDSVWLAHFNEVTGAVEKYLFPVKLVSNEHRFITDFYIDEKNKFWLCTKQGLFSFEPGTKKWQHYLHSKSDSRSLSNDAVLSACPDPAEPTRYIWIGTEGGGMNKLDIASGTFTHYTTENGLPNNVVYGIQSDRHNNLWLSTNNGLCLFNTKTFETRNFTTDDGLPGNEFNRYAYSKTKEGHLYFGGPSGGVLFNPDDFYKAGNPSTVIINQLKLLNKPVSFSAKQVEKNSGDYFLPAPIEHCEKLEFTYNQSMITFGFALLDLTTPLLNRFKYKMDGFNEEWIDAGELHEATFTNLSPGSYTFKVLGRNSNNVWSTEPATLQFTILPPWWGTWWFRLLILVVIASGIYSFYRYRLAQQTRLLTIRNRIASDLHDEIGSTLSSISLSSTVIQKKMNGDSAGVNTLLNQISTNTDNMMEAMNDIVWTINTKNDRFDNVINRMRAFAVEMLEPKGCFIHFNADENLNALTLDMQQRKNLYLIFKEAVNNAAKYSDCKNVWIDITMNGSKKISLKIKDDGKGFSPLSFGEGLGVRPGGNGISNMHKRADELKGDVKINSTQGKGTEINLEIKI